MPQSHDPQPVYRLRNVVKRREKGGNVFQLNAPDLSILPGEFVAIIGQSGCGKSTLLDMLGLVLSPTSGDEFSLINEDGSRLDVAELSEKELASIRKARLGYVLQTGGLLPFLSVRKNIMLPCRLNRQTEREAEMEELVRGLGIHDQLDKKPQFLSGGQRQRVAIARALAHRPPIVLADEPTAAVDKYTAREIRNQFKELTSSQGITLLMVTHDESLVKNVMDRAITFDLERKSPTEVISTCLIS